jgi:hypothetical protein
MVVSPHLNLGTTTLPPNAALRRLGGAGRSSHREEQGNGSNPTWKIRAQACQLDSFLDLLHAIPLSHPLGPVDTRISTRYYYEGCRLQRDRSMSRYSSVEG